MDIQFVLSFLEDLSQNNNKKWMEVNSLRYQKTRSYMIELAAEIIEKISVFDADILELDPKKTLFRINRDIRFSKDKTPYKTNFGIAIMPGGKKTDNPGYYIHVKPKGSMVGGGLYAPMPETLKKIRQEIDYHGERLQSILRESNFKKTFGNIPVSDHLKTAPKGYPKDHPYVEFLKFKHFAFMKSIPDHHMQHETLLKEVVETSKILLPLNAFLKEAIA